MHNDYDWLTLTHVWLLTVNVVLFSSMFASLVKLCSYNCVSHSALSFCFPFFLAKTALWQSWRWLIFSELFQTDWERITKKLKCFFSVQKGLCNKILFRAFGSCGKMKEIYETFTTGKLCWDPCSWNAFMGSNLRNSLLVRMPFNIPNSSVFLEYWLGVIKTQLSQKQYLPVNLYSLFHLRGSGIKI